MPKQQEKQNPSEIKEEEAGSKDRPLYVISVAAELVDMHPQTLRLYERKGLIEPSRSSGKTRLYSQRDIEHLQEIRRLTQELGVNLAGVEEIIRLRRQLDDTQRRLEGRIDNIQEKITEKVSEYKARVLELNKETSPSE